MKKRNVKTILCILGLTLSISGKATENVYAGAWAQDNTGWWYDNGDGTYPAASWQWIDGAWYCFDGSGYMRTGWIDNTYYCASSGAMVTEWYKIGSSWYYFAGDGSVVRDQWIGDYYLLSSGKMAVNRWIDGYWVGSDGKWIPGYEEDDEEDQYASDDDETFYQGSDSSSSSNHSSGSSNQETGNTSESSGTSSSGANNQVSNTNIDSTAAASQQGKDGWEKEGREWYYYENGEMVRNRLIKSGSNWYYVGSGGMLMRNTTITADGKEYRLDSSGVARENGERSTLSIDGHTKIVSYTIGEDFPLDGVITSNYKIERIEITIKKNTKTAYKKTFNPNAKEFDLRSLAINAAEIKNYGKGTWSLMVVVEDADETIGTMIHEDFTANVAEAVRFELSNETIPRRVSYGCNFGLYGVISCNYVIDEVDGRICKKQSGADVVMRKEVYPNAKTYDIHGPVNDALIFEQLEKGTYFYIVTAKAKGKEHKLICKSFVVD
ncbi:hypothetical protein [Lacrimispora sp. 210928-DFI.3.58]|uniref:hypothetical protein n=1 Tax=Lacrimispora sp. 210928-DFI.3.58 TaxID=2883214 RepID=UPI001D07DD69|nr:hypothetical protein [Lacrimispora sp. 210928-DFI.3.58]MCB7317799.1 hypothetical protein [Lacrimispora sp. 210928-DFI.3.58]